MRKTVRFGINKTYANTTHRKISGKQQLRNENYAVSTWIRVTKCFQSKKETIAEAHVF